MLNHPTRWLVLVALLLIFFGASFVRVRAETTIPLGPKAYRFAVYRTIKLADEKARLDSFALRLQRNRQDKAYIVAYGTCANEANDRLNRAKDYLANIRGIDPRRIVPIDGGCMPQFSVELWGVPVGAEVPKFVKTSAVSPCPPCRSAVLPPPSQSKTVRITLLYLSNVTNASSLDGGTRGGLARISTVRKQTVAESPNTLLLFGGGTLSPSFESTIHKGKQMIEAWNSAGLDAAVLGNNEFDFGPEVLLERINESRFKWLGSNVVDKRTGVSFGQTSPFLIREFGGIKIGIFGVTRTDTKSRSRPGPDLDFVDPCETAKRIVPQVQAAGARFIIALAHQTMSQNKELVKCAPQINLVIGASESVALESVVKGRPILSAENNTAHLGRIDLYLSPDPANRFERMEWSTIPVTDKTREDPSVAAVVAGYIKNPELEKIVFTTIVELDALAAHNRTGETNLGSLVADAFRRATRADVALINGGSFRANTLYKAGRAITKRDLLEIFPFQNEVVKLRVSGAVLREALEHGVSRSAEDDEPGRFPQVAGMRFSFDALRPPGFRVVSLTVNDKPVDDKQTYTLATTQFIWDGGDGYLMFKDAPNLEERKRTEVQILEDVHRSVQSIAPKVDRRIIRLDRPR